MNTVLRSLAMLLALPTALAAHDFDSVQVKAQLLRNGVYMLTGSGGNIGLSVGPDGAFIIDDQFAPLTGKILAAIKAITPLPVKFVVNTHWHFDHTGGNENMGKAGAMLVAHDNVRKRMSAGQFLDFLKWTEKVARANVIHMGDTYVRYGFPSVDLSSGGNVGGLVHAADRALSFCDAETKVIPGHGDVADWLHAHRSDTASCRDLRESPMHCGGAFAGPSGRMNTLCPLKPMNSPVARHWAGPKPA